MQPARTVLTYGRFDGWNQAHVAFLRQLAQMGREVIVGCATDAHAAAVGTPCRTPYAQRRALLERCRYVTRVVPETSPGQKRTDIVNYNVSLLVMGDDHRGSLDHLQDIAKVCYLPAFPEVYAEFSGNWEWRAVVAG